MNYFKLFFFFLSTSIIINAQNQIGENIEVSDDFFSWASSVSVSGDGSRVAVGGYGKSDFGFRVYEFNNSDWVQIGDDIPTNYPNETSVYTVSLSLDGNRIAVGAVINRTPNDLGYVKIYDFDGVNWNQIGSTLLGESNTDFFGSRLTLSSDGNRLIVGAKFNNNSFGNARVFEFNGTDWIQMGNDIDPDGVNEPIYFGTSVSISPDGNRVAVGANQYYDEDLEVIGLVRIYEFDGFNWVQLGGDLLGENLQDNFGVGLSLTSDGNKIAVGSIASEGYVKVFEFSNSNWEQIGETILSYEIGSRFGFAVVLFDEGNRIAIGAPYNSQNGNSAGKVRIYQLNNSVWFRLGEDILGDNNEDKLGESLSISLDGTTLATGALDYIYDQSGTESGYAKVFDITNLVLDLTDITIKGRTIFPNPAIESFQINNAHDVKEVFIYDSYGKLILSEDFYNQKINISSFKQGIYHVILKNFKNENVILKLVKR